MDASRRPTAWTLSLGAHAAILLAFAFALGGGHRHEPVQPPTRLVYVEPAPALALGARGEVSDTRRTDTSPAAIEPQPQARREATRPEAPRLVTTPPHSRSTPRHDRPLQERHADAPAASADPVVTGTATERAAPGSTGGAAGGAALGSARGVQNGVVGGLGEAPLALRDVAAPPEVLDRVLPDYPPRARAMQIEGQVLVEVVLDRSGHVEESVRVTRSIPALDAAAVAAVRQWRFRPARDRDGRPVRVVMEIPVRFVLR